MQRFSSDDCSFPLDQGNAMEQLYWIDRKRASIANAERATSSKARLVHYELAGLYSLKAAEASVADPALPAQSSPS